MMAAASDQETALAAIIKAVKDALNSIEQGAG
jgi:hypothetical protein